jgi:hypothetical protein
VVEISVLFEVLFHFLSADKKRYVKKLGYHRLALSDDLGYISDKGVDSISLLGVT